MGQCRTYSIITPEYSVTSGGIRVMHALRSWLEIKGQVVFLNGMYKNDPDFITIYPEIIHGNPTNGKYVIRYILAPIGMMASHGIPGPSVFPVHDELYYFSKLYNNSNANSDHEMFLPVLNLHLFKDQGKARTKQCVFTGHCEDKHLPSLKDCIKIDKNITSDQSLLADILNECDVMYSYEQVSAMFEIARLCGCRVVIIPDGRYTKEQFTQYEPGMNGISWGMKEEEQLDIRKFRDHYIEMVKVFDKKIDKLIDWSQSWKR